MPPRANQLEPDLAFLTPYVVALEGLGIEAVPMRTAVPPGIDARLDLRGPWGHAKWDCELKYRLERGTIGPIIHRMQELKAKAGRALLLTEHVTPPVAQELWKHGVMFVDAAGNAFLQDKGLYIWVTHRQHHRIATMEHRGIHAAALKLLFVLLQQRIQTKNHRELAGDAGIALGGVGRILRELERRAWIHKVADGVELRDAPAMLKRWDEGYADTLRARILAHTCRGKPGTTMEQLPARLIKAKLTDRILIGGELGAALLTQNLAPEAATLHLDGIDADEAMRRLELVPDRAGDIVLLKTFGRLNRADPKDHLDPRLADPLLIRGELLLKPDERLHEVAEAVRTDHIEPRWK